MDRSSASKKETEHHWEEGEDVSLLEAEPIVYAPGETENLVSDPILAQELRQHSIRTVVKAASCSPTTVKATG